MTTGEIIILVVVIAGILITLNSITMTNEELVQRLDAQTDKMTKIQAEVQALKDAINNSGGVPAEVTDALARLEAAIATTDDMNEDTPPA